MVRIFSLSILKLYKRTRIAISNTCTRKSTVCTVAYAFVTIAGSLTVSCSIVHWAPQAMRLACLVATRSDGSVRLWRVPRGLLDHLHRAEFGQPLWGANAGAASLAPARATRTGTAAAQSMDSSEGVSGTRVEVARSARFPDEMSWEWPGQRLEQTWSTYHQMCSCLLLFCSQLS